MSVWHPLSSDDDPRSVDWSISEVGPHPLWLNSAGNKNRPDLLQLAKEAIARSGRDPYTVDLVDVVTVFINFMFAQARTNFQQSRFPEAIVGLDTIDGRSDLDVDMIWNYFTHWGVTGAAVHEVVAEVVASEDAIGVVVSGITEGRFDKQ